MMCRSLQVTRKLAVSYRPIPCLEFHIIDSSSVRSVITMRVNKLHVFLFVISVVSSDDCSLYCDCDKLKISCSDSLTKRSFPLMVIPISNSDLVKELVIINHNIKILKNSEFNIAHLYNLVNINITQSNLEQIQEDSFNNLTKLNILILSYNSISVLYDNTFKPINKIQHLHLDNNKLTTINNKIFSVLKNLQKLVLSNNRLITFDDHALQNNIKLTQLYLNNNSLKSLKIDFSNLKTLKINQNPWTCNCLIQNLFSFIKSKTGPSFRSEIKNTFCDAPLPLKDQSWQKIQNPEKFSCWVRLTPRQDQYENGIIGGNVTLYCKIESNSITKEKWTFGTQDIDITDKRYRVVKKKLDHQDQPIYWYQLTINNLNENDEGKYRCKVNDTLTGLSHEEEIKLFLQKRKNGHFIAVSLVVFVTFCLILIIMKIAIKWHINKQTSQDQPNFQEAEDTISAC